MQKWVILALVVGLSCGSAKADVSKLHPAEHTCDVNVQACTLQLRFYGVIDQPTLDKFKAIVESERREAARRDFFFTLLSVDLDSPGGSVDAAMEIGKIIRKEDTMVVVDQDHRCFSSCVLILSHRRIRATSGNQNSTLRTSFALGSRLKQHQAEQHIQKHQHKHTQCPIAFHRTNGSSYDARLKNGEDFEFRTFTFASRA